MAEKERRKTSHICRVLARLPYNGWLLEKSYIDANQLENKYGQGYIKQNHSKMNIREILKNSKRYEILPVEAMY